MIELDEFDTALLARLRRLHAKHRMRMVDFDNAFREAHNIDALGEHLIAECLLPNAPG